MLIRLKKGACLYWRLMTIILLLTGIGFSTNAFGVGSWQIWLSETEIHFYVPNQGYQGLVEAEEIVKIDVLSRIENWSLTYLAAPLEGIAGQIPANQILMETPYTGGFQPVHLPRLVAQGGTTEQTRREVSRMRFKFLAKANNVAGEYKSLLVSPEGGPPLRISLTIGEALPGMVDRLSVKSILFQASHGPDTYTEIPQKVCLRNLSEPMSAELKLIREMESEGGAKIPVERCFLDGVQLTNMLNTQNVYFNNQCLQFTLQTEWWDKPGLYSGVLRFVYEDHGEENLMLVAYVSAYARMDASPDRVHFEAPKPGIHQTDHPIDLYLGTNVPRWVISVEATPLLMIDNEDMRIDNGNILIKCEAEGGNTQVLNGAEDYIDLSERRTIFGGSTCSFEKKGSVSVSVRTTFAHMAGDYQGTITFTCAEDW